MAFLKESEHSFRDDLSNIDEKGKRKWIFPTKPKGKFTRARYWLSYFYFALFFGLPFLRIHGKPVLLFNIPEGKFIIFGAIFWPQDFFIFGLIMVAAILAIALFTMAYGRIFCGWICPQTIFLESLFRRIEYLIDGDAARQRWLRKQAWTPKKAGKRILKHSLFLLISLLIANTFLAYIIGTAALFELMTEPIAQHLGGFMAILVFTGVFYGVFAFLRELVCTNICPYGRLQSVLLDKDSIVVAYDYKRGEPKAKFRKVQGDAGDCIDCDQCVKVCPTGIDIRNGTQLECVNCTACIDACDAMMKNINRPLGLIRYDSENNIAEGKKSTFSPKLKAYTAALLAIIMGIAVLLFNSENVDGSIIRSAGMLYQERGTDSISNLYNIKFINKTFDQFDLTLQLEDRQGTIAMVGKQEITMKPESQGASNFFIVLPRSALQNRKEKLKVGVYQNGKLVLYLKTTFLGPMPQRS
ncbi:cytochrome c oxidase accessory protein CcoG [Taibaiella sp. KBW10]|uniref:cytochrome c oxidase accessory protein CcoG n=1 Tax=Taibaiella sp. KBW10 TaxID=2153357 RepID=UPI000F5A5E84|nr:cytochrome c oxidase accessory protein CcoG [Taibaiella sp. KBW10]RQO30070.1 cytochrome c oxidase accessory protein CcoG [Taibaiella sp. KBW10]